MFDEKVENEILESSDLDKLVTPRYEDYSFANIPGTVKNVFGMDSEGSLPESVLSEVNQDGVEKVAVVFVDAFGYTQWKDYGRDLEFFENVIEHGKVTPLTAVYPSETAAAVTTINTGLTPLQHSVPSWRVYVEEIDEIVRTLPFTTMDRQDLSEREDFSVDDLYKGTNIYNDLDSQGISSTAILPNDISDSDYNSTVMNDASIAGFENAFDMALKLRTKLENSNGKEYLHCYTGQVDSALHQYGPGSKEHFSQLESVSQALSKQLVEKVDEDTAEKTLMILVADHGQTKADSNIVDLLSFDMVKNNLEQDDSGDIILPTGGPRTAILHIEQGKVGKVKEFLDQELKAEVLRTEEAISKGLFGKGHASSRNRFGDIIIIPKESGKMIWYDYQEYKTYEKYKGHHGGMSKEEMLVPFAAVKLDELI
jgi:Uncharacterized proteins of the AP superfamily